MDSEPNILETDRERPVIIQRSAVEMKAKSVYKRKENRHKAMSPPFKSKGNESPIQSGVIHHSQIELIGAKNLLDRTNLTDNQGIEEILND